eukprot:GGOE01005398.1.p1 GENE.GGOE01005398.1~~GGOE01005398.1.p1  ORF type:complete len:663 (-),score=171.88 GGOE01005398.1:675-2663(-)
MGDMPAPVDAVRPPRDERLMAVLLSRSGDAGPLLTCTLAASQKSCDKSKPYGARGAEGKGPLRHHCEPLATAGSTPQPPPKNRQADAGRRKGRPGRPTSSPPVCGPVLAMAGTGAGEKRCASAHSEPCPLPLLASLPPASKLPAICGGVGATRMLLASSSHPAPPDCLVMPEVAVPSDLPDESLTAAATTEGEEGEEGECKSDDGLPSHDAEDEEEGEAEAEADGTEAEDDSPELELARELAIENQIGALPIEPEFSADGKAVIIRLIQPVYPSVAVNGKSVMYPATVWFSEKQVPPEKQLPRPNAEGLIKLRKGNVAKALFFCIGAGAVPFRVVLNTFRLSGFRQVEDGKWNVMWAKRVTPEEYQALNPFQRINHFPGTWGIGRKDNLARNLMRMRRRHGMEQYGFFVPSYIMPGDYRQLAQEFARHPQTFIVKPVASACARGIRLISRLPRPGRFKGHLVQKYIRNPLLLNGYKFDIRLYVVVTSFDPLRAYLFNEGLIRLASEPYQGGSSRLKNRCMHLTNYSINHTNATYVQPDGSAGESASKWCLADLIRWWGKRQGELKKSWDEVHTQIVDVIVKTLLSIEAQVTQQCARLCRHRNTCFELFGFDVLLDANCKPWVIEVNIMPSLCPSSVLDHGIKSQLIANLLTLKPSCGPARRA